ncbi:hypothetical protein ACGFIE_05245 [Micromonospora sp. NPDC049275]|uniref:hypothetical protein n=1 Tax=Micromonospora sp. NPDC049275 TaxID=3364268 RepID=UPI0037217448
MKRLHDLFRELERVPTAVDRALWKTIDHISERVTAERLSVVSRVREAVFKPAPANANYGWTDQWNRTYDATGDSSVKNQKLDELLASFDPHLIKGNDFTVVDMTGYPGF